MNKYQVQQIAFRFLKIALESETIDLRQIINEWEYDDVERDEIISILNKEIKKADISSMIGL